MIYQEYGFFNMSVDHNDIVAEVICSCINIMYCNVDVTDATAL
jgi:hypothetical protein